MLETLTQPLLIVSAVCALFIGQILLGFFILRLYRNTQTISERQNMLFQGESAKNLESVILKQAENIALMDKEIQELFEISNAIHRLASRSIHKVGVVRFNPFKEVGSNQSFSIALLDGKNSGTIISSIHTREGARVYAKPITSGQSESFPLTEEEKQAIEHAQQVHSTKKQ